MQRWLQRLLIPLLVGQHTLVGSEVAAGAVHAAAGAVKCREKHMQQGRSVGLPQEAASAGVLAGSAAPAVMQPLQELLAWAM